MSSGKNRPACKMKGNEIESEIQVLAAVGKKYLLVMDVCINLVGTSFLHVHIYQATRLDTLNILQFYLSMVPQ